MRKVIERYFRIYEERDALPGLEQAVLVAFYVMTTKEELEATYPDLQRDLRALDPQLMPVLRTEGGETIIVVTRRADTKKAVTKLPLFLFLATVVTLSLAGGIALLAFERSIEIARIIQPRFLGLGFLYFALPLLFVFGVQEVARRIVAKRHGVYVGPSYLVPVPPFVFFPSIGTFGSILHAREPYPDRKVLFDLSAVGPLAGFLAALPVLIVGILMTNAAGVAVPDGGAVTLEVIAPDGTAWTEDDEGLFDPFERSTADDPNRAHNVTVTFSTLVAGREYGSTGWRALALGQGQTGDPLETTLTARAIDVDGEVLGSMTSTREVSPGGEMVLPFDLPNGTERVEVVMEYAVPDRTTIPLGEPLAFHFVFSELVAGDLVIHPVGLAGWTAFLVIGITLIPAGRLDGGGVARALFGERMVIIGYLAVGGLAVLVFMYPGWLYLVLFIILFLGVRHPAALNETVPLDAKRKVIALLLLLVLVLSFVPVPAQVPGAF